MEKMLTDICEYLNNYFIRERYDVTLTIEDGTFTSDVLQTGQYFRIVGSVFNDGIHQYPATDLEDERFTGSIWALAIPKNLIELADEIAAWQAKYGSIDSASMSPFNSESFGNYSYSKDSSANGSSGIGANTWQAVYGSRLNKWRRLRNI